MQEKVIKNNLKHKNKSIKMFYKYRNGENSDSHGKFKTKIEKCGK